MTACISSRIENYAAFMGGAFAQTVETLPANEGSFRPGEPCRDLLNPADAARYLRLDEQKIANPKAVLDGYRKNGQLRSVAVSREIYYLKPDLDALLLDLSRNGRQKPPSRRNSKGGRRRAR